MNVNTPTEGERELGVRGVASTPGETLGLLVAPLAAALVCALPVLAVGGPMGAASVAVLYLAVLGVAPNFAIGRRALAWAKTRRPLTLAMSAAGGALVKIAIVILLTVVGPPVLLMLDHEGGLVARWSALAIAGAWALPVVAVLGAIEGGVFWSVTRWWDRRLKTIGVAGRS